MIEADPADLYPSQCAFPGCECPGEGPACDDYEETSDHAYLLRLAGGRDQRKTR